MLVVVFRGIPGRRVDGEGSDVWDRSSEYLQECCAMLLAYEVRICIVGWIRRTKGTRWMDEWTDGYMEPFLFAMISLVGGKTGLR